MSYTAGSVMDLAASLMNDTPKTLYTYTVQLPFLKMAQRDLQNDFILNDIKVALEVSAVIDVAANATTLTLPADFFLPIRLEERADGSTNVDDFFGMTERKVEPGTRAGSTLGIWSYREGEIQFVGATGAREVRLTYWRLVPSAVSDASVTSEDGAQNVLAYRTAMLCTKHVGHNIDRAAELLGDYQTSFDTLIGVYTKNNQSLQGRRLPFRRTRA
jgi:hypothetical protein